MVNHNVFYFYLRQQQLDTYKFSSADKMFLSFIEWPNESSVGVGNHMNSNNKLQIEWQKNGNSWLKYEEKNLILQYSHDEFAVNKFTVNT